ncbi:MAG: hypothetical protein A2Y33_00415 [Spirochaetes bacterium GWF1_51_8]|nr:MAG: hypothetical protein A2Y33_00415 [Spirochaetes bacterium GWF1_51_8]
MDKDSIKKSEIVSVLNQVRLKHIGVSVKGMNNNTIISGFVTKSDSNYMTIFFDKIPDLIPIKNLKLTFEYNRMFYSSEPADLRSLSLPLKNIDMLIPEGMSSHLMRKYTRVQLPQDGIKMAILSLESSSDQPQPSKPNMEELPPNMQKIYIELSGENPDIKKIVQMIGEELSRYSSFYKTNIFKDINSLSPLEKVVYHYQKTFWINDTDNLNNYVHLGAKYNIIGYEKYFEMAGKTLSPEILEQIRANYLNRNVISYCMVPILIGDLVSGVIEVSVPNDPKYKHLTIYDIYYIKGLADILGEVVVKSKMKTATESDAFSVIDISMGGLLANTKNVYLARSFPENSIVKLALFVNDKKVEVTARIVRYDYIPGENAGLNIALEFLTLTEENKAEIGNFIRNFLKISVKSEAPGASS